MAMQCEKGRRSPVSPAHLRERGSPSVACLLLPPLWCSEVQGTCKNEMQDCGLRLCCCKRARLLQVELLLSSIMHVDYRTLHTLTITLIVSQGWCGPYAWDAARKATLHQRSKHIRALKLTTGQYSVTKYHTGSSKSIPSWGSCSYVPRSRIRRVFHALLVTLQQADCERPQ